ncbi:hypothetical protein B1R32_1176 [Abditibacterium utsteinense]|uniref:Uncharacterized protein n=1 Tax=Abditibacterium utsteinense TaxID=1960156 RepID=A0A2S8SQ89_9BACT|nr:hypothetical protein [Abditibacterium utsteinense]PQV62964.1 hypothetical protein B1R32_1176 [Abditibacterium utsteinense]
MKSDFEKAEARRKSKQEEAFDVLQFLRANQNLEQSEEPDFVFDFLGVRVGIEHTRLLKDETAKGSPLKARENWQSDVVQAAYELYCSSLHQSLYVIAEFNDRIVFKIQDKPLLSQALCSSVREVEELGYISEQGLYLECWSANRALKNKIPQAISHLWIRKGRGSDELWSISGGGAIGALPAEMIQNCLNRKEKRISNYRERCKELWLLIVVAGNGMSSMFEDRDQSFSEQLYQSSFDKVFLLNKFHNRVHSIQIEPSKTLE